MRRSLGNSMAEPEGRTEAPPVEETQREEEHEEGLSKEEEPADAPLPAIVTEEGVQDAPPSTLSPSGPTPTTADFSESQRSPFAHDEVAEMERPENRAPLPSRPRTESQSTTATATTQRSGTRNSLVFVVRSLETIAASKDARRNKKLADSLQRALSAIKEDGDPARINPEILFEPLQLAAEQPTIQTVNTALDCIGKLISYSYFAIPAEPQNEPSEQPPLIERAIDTICDCFQSEATPVETQLQIVQSLLSAILNDKIVVHGAGLLKAVRMMYNIFLLSKSSEHQKVAQGALTQMVGTVFERVKNRLDMKEARVNSSKASLDRDGLDDAAEVDGTTLAEEESTANGTPNGDHDASETASTAASDMPVEKRDAPKMTLQSFENRKSFDDAKITDTAPTLVTRAKGRRTPNRQASGAETLNGDSETPDHAFEDEEDEIYIKDAYLVFRSMCRLSSKPLPADQAIDVRSQGSRSKLLSLNIIYTILNNHTSVFTSPYATIKSSSTDDPTSFVQAIKQYLCQSIVRNGGSSVRLVFEVSCEIYWLMLKYMRVMLKKELEVFLKEIYLKILDTRASPAWQKQMILSMFSRLAADPRAIVEVYLNYDCDRTALDNMYERIVEHLSKISTSRVEVTVQQQVAFQKHHAKVTESPSDWQQRVLPPSLATAAIHAPHDADQGFPAEYAMKQESLEILVEILRSLAQWSQHGDMPYEPTTPGIKKSAAESRESFELRESSANVAASPHIGGAETPIGTGTPIPEDDPSQIDRAKQRKTAMANAVRTFNFKPKRGIKMLLKEGFIESDIPRDIARFLLGNEQISKAALGEFLGEGEEDNIAIMHAFLDLMDFRQTRFVDALRRFLQSFRLPGEAQKIDRFMLKFAERYITGNPKAFANADTAYVLAYSVIMLNTDQHSANIKGRRMTPEDFIKNNRGINDNADLPEDYLRGIFDEIQHNEIVLDSERETAANLGQLPPTSAGLAATIGQAVVNAGRDQRKEEYAQTEQLANRTEQLYKSLLRAQRKGTSKIQLAKFVPATSFKHAGPMFQVTWAPFLTALASAAQETENIEILRMCLEGLKLGIRIACLFDLDDPREAFVAALAKFTNLYKVNEMKARNLEALKVLLDVAILEGNHLNGAWGSILTCISQLDRFQLISGGVDEGVVPDVLKVATQGKPQLEKRRTLGVPKSHRPRQLSGTLHYQQDVAEETRSAEIIRSVDRIFTNTANLNGEAIIYFVKALTHVSWQEIQSSGQSDSPRTYSLQKIVEICNYNMTRVRFEWANIWQVLGAHFNQVGCHTNTHVVFFAIDSLRQLSMRFLDIEELPGFKFQKDFLKPFEHVIANTTVVAVKDMVLRCLIQMIQAKGENIRSGWRTIFGVFTVAAREAYGKKKISHFPFDPFDQFVFYDRSRFADLQLEGIVSLAYDHVTQVYNTRFGVVISQGAFADLIVCLTQFSKNMKFQKKSLQAIELLKSSVPKMLRTPECPLSHRAGLASEPSQARSIPQQPTQQTQEEQFWFPVLFAFHDVLMTGDDLEVRSRALTYLFETLMQYGRDFPPDFWDTLWRQLLYPIFMVLRSKAEMNKMANHEDLAVWLSTTLIQALRNMVTLFTHFFESLEYMLDRFLDLLILCICQENDTLARIGSNCLQQLILQNVKKFTPEHWHRIVDAFVELFQRTEATALFSAATSSTFPAKSPINGTATTQNSSSEAQSLADLPLQTPTSEPEADASDNALGINGLSPNPSQSSISTDAEPPTPRQRSTQSGPTDLEDFSATSTAQETPVPVTQARRKFFNQIITKCVLSLLMIETVNELFSNDNVYAQIPSSELLRLMALLKKSYHFAKRFNGDRELRTRLYKEGFMKQPPNLLKQESGAAAVYVAILFRMYQDSGAERLASREQTEAALVPLCADIVKSYVELDEDTQQRNIVTWRPVVVDVLEGLSSFGKDEFEKCSEVFKGLVVQLMNRDMGAELQRAVQGFVARSWGLEDVQLMTPVSERGGWGSRRGSRVVR